MRISTSQIYQSGLNNMLEQQHSLYRTQEQLATGKRINRPSDDPVGAARLQEVQRAIDQQDVFINNIGRAGQRLSVEESVLASAGNSIQRVRELAVQAASDTVDDGSRAMIARELRQRIEELVALANSQDSDGQYIFAGASSGNKPFILAGGTVSYQGDSVQRELAVGPGTTMRDGDTGDHVFMRIRDGNGTVQATPDAGNSGTGLIELDGRTNPVQWTGDTYSLEFTAADTWEVRDSNSALVAGPGSYEPGGSIEFDGVRLNISGEPQTGDTFTIEPARNVSVFETVRELAEVLENAQADEVGRTERRQVLNDSLMRLDNAEQHLLAVRADLGGRLNSLDHIEESHESLKLSLQELGSEIRDLDYAEAISRMEQQMVALQAAQQSFVQIQGLSLFNYIR